MNRRWWDDPSSYDHSIISDDKRQNIQYLKGMFFLKTMLGTVVSAIDWYYESGENIRPLANRINKNYRKLLTACEEILGLPYFSNIQKFYPELPYSLDGDTFGQLNYLEDIHPFYEVICKEYQLGGEQTFAIPVEFRSSIARIQETINTPPDKLLELSMDRIALKHKNYEHLTIHENGLIEYQDREGNLRQYQSKTSRSDYKFLKYLAGRQKTQKPVHYDEISKAIKAKKPSDGFSDSYNRIREMYKIVKSNLKLERGELIRLDKGYMLTCPAKVK